MAQEYDLLTINPRYELKFEGPFNSPVTSWIRLTNNTDKNVYFKLKTTAPRRYCVRPNSGSILPKEYVEVQVLLQPFTYNPADKNKHKFMIQSVLMPEGSLKTPEDLLKSIDPEKIMNYKLKCVFEAPAPPPGTEQVEASEEPILQSAPLKPILPGLGGEVQKTASVVNQLREEESKLRQENIALKEELLRLRKDRGDNLRHSYSPPAVQQSVGETSISLQTIFIGVGLLVVAFFVGRFLQ